MKVIAAGEGDIVRDGLAVVGLHGDVFVIVGLGDIHGERFAASGAESGGGHSQWVREDQGMPSQALQLFVSEGMMVCGLLT